MSGIYKAMERWASQSDDNMRLAIGGVCLGLGISVILAIMVAAWIMGYNPF